VGLDNARGVILDISGTKKLHKSEENLAQKILTQFLDRGIKIKIGIGPTIGSAWAIAQFGSLEINCLRSLKDALAPLPIEALRIETQASQALHQIGVFQIAQLMQLPRQALALRFGKEVLQKLDQALGLQNETFNAIHAPEFFSIRRAFESPIFKEQSLRAMLLRLIEELISKLKKQNRTAKRFRIELIDPKKKLSKTELSFNFASDDIKHINQVLEASIQKFSIPDGVQIIRIEALELELALRRQNTLLGDAHVLDSMRSSQELINHLGAKLGNSNINQVNFKASHIPERSFKFTSFDKDLSPQTLPSILDRPSYIFPRPEPFSAIALLPDKPPSRIEWQGRKFKIIKALGPEKISLEWWHSKIDSESMRTLEERQYFKIQEEQGRWLWVFRTKDLRWFVHGVWA